MEPNIGITKKNLEAVIKVLSVALANQTTLYVKTRNFHWNVSGPSFMELHLLFEKQYTQLEKNIDEVAERIGKLGGKTIGTMTEFLELTVLKEMPNTYPDQTGMLKELLKDHETVIKSLRDSIETVEANEDAGTTDFLTGLLKDHETIAWTLRRYLQ